MKAARHNTRLQIKLNGAATANHVSYSECTQRGGRSTEETEFRHEKASNRLKKKGLQYRLCKIFTELLF